MVLLPSVQLSAVRPRASLVAALPAAIHFPKANVCPAAICAGLCCQAQNQFGCGTACCDSFTQVCDQYRQICTLRFNNACVAGQIWCPGAQQCCPIGTICTFNQCTTVNAVAAGPGSPVRAAFGGRRLHAAHL